MTHKKKKSYLVTGGTGFIGRHLVRRLVQDGHEVVVFDDNSRGRIQTLSDLKHKIKFVAGDIRDLKAVEKAVKNVDSVCHLAFVNGTEFFYTKPELVLEVGVKGIVNVLDACIKHKVKELILASSSEVYQTPAKVPTDETAGLSIPDPLNPRYSYAAGKMISEIMAINYGRKLIERVVVFRPHNVYGPQMGWEHVIPQFVLRMKELVAKQKTGTIQFPIKGTGLETRAFIYIDDFIDGLSLVINKGKHLGIYHIGTLEELSIKEVAALVGSFYQRAVKIIPGESAKGGTVRRCPDISKIKSMGFKPKFSFKEGLALTAEWYDKNSKH
jgi:nucleoside-diphosphate-sugar epimerase